MKWATNKRLHFELGIIKSIQTLGEVRITDVIKVLTRGADAIEAQAPAAPRIPAASPASPVTVPAPPEPEPAGEPEAGPPPAVPAKATPKPAASGVAALDSWIDAAPEVSEPPPPPPAPAPVETPEPAPAAPVAPSAEDVFHQDPLILSALEKFEGKVVSG
jgi:DNA polymerase-3 subunit gamma/tau